MSKLRLHGTPLSHFTRKVRIVLDELGVDYEIVPPTGVLGTDAGAYGGNPLLRVPTLEHDGRAIVESDHIARWIVAQFDSHDVLRVRSDDIDDINRLAVANGVMDDEVVLILAKRAGHVDLDGVAYFRKLRVAIDSGLAWLEAHLPNGDSAFDYAAIATLCMWEHLVHYQLVQGLDRWPRLAAHVARFSDRPSVARSTPTASLAEAAAAGWKPA